MYSERIYRVSYQLLLATRYSRMRYLLNGTTYYTSSCITMGPIPIVAGVATFSSEHHTICSQRSKMSASKKHQWSYKVLNVRTAFSSIYWRDFDLTHQVDSQYICDCLLKVWSHAPSWLPQEGCRDGFTSLWADFCCNTSLCSCSCLSSQVLAWAS